MTRAGDNGKTRPSDGRAARLASALRDNLRRRKLQERERRARETPEARGPAPGEDKDR
jgi:hypothetical protein